MPKKNPITKSQIKILVNDKEVKDYDINNVKLDHTQEESICMFEVPSTKEFKEGDKLDFYFKKKGEKEANQELDGQIVKVTHKNNKTQIYGSTTALPELKWTYDIVSNWGTGVFILFAVVASKVAGYGFILFNFGFYICQKPVVKKEK